MGSLGVRRAPCATDVTGGQISLIAHVRRARRMVLSVITYPVTSVAHRAPRIAHGSGARERGMKSPFFWLTCAT